ncbi:MAG TPA: tetratricopeptide repeat protein [Labilithrix sp.]|nr:tetratricopeptide repeat protein [Labilithrix sp.]
MPVKGTFHVHFGRAAVALIAALTSSPASARDALCRAAPPVDAAGSTDALLAAADALVSPLDRPRARALYLAVLARDPEDEEAAVGLARTDAADECFALAERGYRDVLARSPGNVDARAGLADVLVWTRRWREAEGVLDTGLAHAPLSPELLSRRGRVAYFSGDPTAARRYLAEAERVSPLDPEVRQARDRVYLGQVRLGQRVQIYPEGYDDLYTTDTSAMIRWRRLRFELGAQVVTRHGAERSTRSGPVRTTVIDGRPTFGTYYHFANGAWAGGAVGTSAPAYALPRYAYSLSGFTPLGRVFSAHLSTAYWQYRDDRDVVIVSPAIGMAVTESIDVIARYWLTSVIAANPSGDTTVAHVHSAGLRVGWRVLSRLTLGVDYTYGVQLERNPSATELVDLRSHIVSLLAVVLLDRSFGIDAALSGERRMSLGTGPDVFGPAAEIGAFVRW